MNTVQFSTFILSLALLLPTYAQEPAIIPPKLFESPVEASDAFINATKSGEQQEILAIFGDKHQELIGTNEPERDKELRAKVAAMAIERRRFRFNTENSVTMVIGAEAWPFPVPIVKSEKGWHFDSDIGIEEIVQRRIGENELSAIANVRAYLDAQRDYAAVPRDGTKVRQFARKFHSSPGKKDGLYWPVDLNKGESPSPAGPEIQSTETPHDGYHYKILSAQGEAAPGGKYDYIINGHFIGGFALIAWPSEYGKTGIMTFIINHYGILHECDLGPDTAKAAGAISEYNPTEAWIPTEN